MAYWFSILAANSSYLAACMFYIISFNRVRGKIPKLIGAVLILSIVVECMNIVLSYNMFNTTYSFVFYDLLVGLLLAIILLRLLTNQLVKSIGSTLLIVHVVISCLRLLSIYTELNVRANYSSINLNVLVMYLCMSYYYQILVTVQKELIHRQPTFWIVTGCFLLFGGTLFLYLFESLLPVSIEGNWVYTYIWPIQHVCTILFNASIIYAIWIARRA